jgi:hypothetical protein
MGEVGVRLALVTDAALSCTCLQYGLSISRFGSRARGCWLGGEMDGAADARRAASARRPFFLFQMQACKARRAEARRALLFAPKRSFDLEIDRG